MVIDAVPATVTAVRAAPKAVPATGEVVVLPGRLGGDPLVSIRSGLLAPRLLFAAPGLARIALVATTATLLAGDTIAMAVHVGDGIRLELQDVAATVAYNGRGRQARWAVTIQVGQDATLVWRGEPLVVADGADVVRTLHLDVAREGRVLLRDLVVLGRHGEPGGALRCTTSAQYDGEILLVEDLDIACGETGQSGQHSQHVGRRAPGVIGTNKVLETLTCVADPVPIPIAPAGDDAVLMNLAGAGLVARRVGAHTHASPLEPTWESLVAQFSHPEP